MSRFSEYLERVILCSGITERELAKASGFTRSYIALMRNGQRVSPDIEKMTKLMYALNLPPYEFDELREEYYRARIGDEAYERDLAVMNFISSFNNISEHKIKSHYRYEISDIKAVNNRMELECLVKAVIKNEAMKKNGFVHIIMQGTDNALKDVLPDVCRSNRELEIEHIVCMEQYGELSQKRDQLYNVKMLKELIPITVFSNSHNYKIYYYYDHIDSRFNPGMLLSYMVLTSEYHICMDANMTVGTISRDIEIRELYEQLFQRHKQSCRELFFYIEDDMDMLSCGNFEIDDVTYSVAQQPWFGVLKLDGLLKKYSNRINRNQLLNLERIIKKNGQKVLEEKSKHIAYCTKEGLNRFAEEGIIDGVPAEIYSLLSWEDRKYMLKLLLNMIEEEKYELFFLDEMNQNIPKELFINIYSLQNVMIVYISKERKFRFMVNESSLNKIMYEAFRNLKRHPKMESKEKGEEYIRYLINRYIT